LSELILTAEAMEVYDADPTILSVGLPCASVGPHCFVSLERIWRPPVGDGCYSPHEVFSGSRATAWERPVCEALPRAV